jgi:LPPG:FO 2-phospho-L-lactate transferase
LVPAERLTVIVNVADDDLFFGLHVSPDVDTTIYNLSGAAPAKRGWGIAGDSSRVLGALERFYDRSWFRIGDRDLATHIFRTDGLRAGVSLHEITGRIAAAYGVRSRILPVSDDAIRTAVRTRSGRWLSFQSYFVERHARDRITAVAYRGLRRARPAPGVLAAIRDADVLLLPPSNPFTSIVPILDVRGVRAAIRKRRVPLVAVSPVAGGRAVRGPLGRMLRAHRMPVSPLAIADLYDGLVDALVIDSADRALKPRLERRGLRVAVMNIHMHTRERSRAVARAALRIAAELERERGWR